MTASSPRRPIGLYVRVSSRAGRDDERFHSPREQEDRARGLCHARGLEPGPVYADIDVSGATPPRDRPGMARLMEAIEAGDLGGVAAYSLDRLSREPSHGDDLVRAITQSGGVILTPDIPDALDTPTGEFTFGMLLQVAKLYRSQAGARFDTAKAGAIARGIPVTNRDAVGYRRGDDRRYHPHPDEAPHVRQVFELRARGAGPTECAEYLEAHGVTTSQGSTTWTRAAIQSLIRSRTYLGEIRSGPHVNPAAHEPLVDEPLWLAAQRPTPAPHRRPSRGGYLLSGILRCAACRYTMQGTTTSRGKRIYRCTRRHSTGLCPSPARVGADDVEARVTHELRSGTRILHDVGDAPDTTHLEDALRTAQARLDQVMTDEARDALGDMWAPDVKARREARDDAARALGEARARDTGDADRIDLIRHWDDAVGLDNLTTGNGTVAFLDTETKRSILAAVFPAVTVERGTHALEYLDTLEGLPRRGYRRTNDKGTPKGP